MSDKKQLPINARSLRKSPVAVLTQLGVDPEEFLAAIFEEMGGEVPEDKVKSLAKARQQGMMEEVEERVRESFAEKHKELSAWQRQQALAKGLDLKDHPTLAALYAKHPDFVKERLAGTDKDLPDALTELEANWSPLWKTLNPPEPEPAAPDTTPESTEPPAAAPAKEAAPAKPAAPSTSLMDKFKVRR